MNVAQLKLGGEGEGADLLLAVSTFERFHSQLFPTPFSPHNLYGGLPVVTRLGFRLIYDWWRRRESFRPP